MNVSDKLEQRLDSTLLFILRETSKLARAHGVKLYLVGGTVRDVLAGFPHRDPDVMATGGFPDFPAIVAKALGGELLKITEFGTASLRIGDVDLDLSTARRETYAQPGALPTVFQGTVEEDLARRDFSVNAMAISLAEDSWGELLDFHGGVRDLEERLIRVLHDRSFRDDATRILRAVRYARRNDFHIESHTLWLFERDLNYHNTISGDRIRHELKKSFREQRAAAMIEITHELGVLSAIHTALRINSNVLAQLHEIQIEQTEDNDLRLLAMLVQSVSVGEAESVIKRLNMGSAWARVVRDVVTIRGLSAELSNREIGRSRVYGLLRGLDPIAIDSCARTATDPTVAQRLRLYLDELRHVRALLDGDDLIVMGVPQGPAIGRLLRDLLDARLDGLVTTKRDEKELVRKEAPDIGPLAG